MIKRLLSLCFLFFCISTSFSNSFYSDTGSLSTTFCEKVLGIAPTASEKRPRIWLKFHSPTGYNRQILVTADPNATNGYDMGFDAILRENFSEDMYWFFSDVAFVIQGVPHFDENQELPIGIKIKEETAFTISIDHSENIPDDMDIFLEDKLLGVMHDLKKGTYESTSVAGKINDRFVLRFTAPELPPEEILLPEIEKPGRIHPLPGFEIFALNRGKELVVLNPQLRQIKKLNITNLFGQQVHSRTNLPLVEKLHLQVPDFRTGIYIISLIHQNGTTTKKVVFD